MSSRIGRTRAEEIGRIVASIAADEIMPRFRAGMTAGAEGVDGLRRKTSAFDVVTAADEATERALGAALLRMFPGAALIGEEAADAGGDALPADLIAGADLAFIIDPLDGTKNFSSGLPLFGTMLAATIRGEIVFGLIHDPVTGETLTALRGEGAWATTTEGRSRELRVAAAEPVAQMHGVAGTNFLPQPLRGRLAHNLDRVGLNFWLRCAAQEYRLAATGGCHFLVYNRLMPWDHAAGWLLHREAGGHSAHLDGTPYLPTHTTGGLICAPDEASWLALREALFGEGVN
ncbi:inositol monophosphatase [Tistrella mobilis]|uniref:inositol monophosphatase family protein n=1 Tax=Tistrella mobilis TaxID=171437 RepID=UPI003557B5EF